MEENEQDKSKKKYEKPEILEVMDFEELELEVTSSNLDVYAFNWY